MKWTITDFKGNSVEIQAIDLTDALDIAYDEHRQALYGNAENWEISNDRGEHYPRQAEYDWDANVYGYER